MLINTNKFRPKKLQRLFQLTVSALLFSSCQSDHNEILAPPIQPSPNLRIAQQVVADSLARGIAIGLANRSVRTVFHADLRDSPFNQHRLHLASYLHGESGRPLAV